ncbi:MAG: glutathione-disulfide reductase [Rhodospirillales bacterium]|nr:MAG: glutathione-disulfide reductase [Rhodospirillales bacterium]
MAGYDYDLFVIGAGSGGVRASRIAAGHGARVGICEDDLVGGTCVIRGCVPKKLLVYGSHVSEEVEDAAAYGWTVPHPAFAWTTLRDNVQKEVMRLNGVYKTLLKGANVDLVVGRGRFMDQHTLDVGGRAVTAGKVLISTGARPWRPSIPGAELAIVSDDAFHLPAMPRRIVIVGGGYIAVEFAGIFNGLGAETTLVLRRDRVLRGFDEECRDAVQSGMKAKGVRFRTDSEVARIERVDGGLRATLKDGATLDADVVMYATGRVPNVAGLGLEKVGVLLDKAGAVTVDEWSQTTTPGIYAVGDVTNRMNLTPVAIMEGHCFADTVFGGRPRKPDHRDVPSAVFSQPQMATVGLTEAEARRVHPAVDVYASSFRPMKHTLTGRDQKTFMKLVVERAGGRVVGAHMVGDDAAELIQGIGIAVKAGATKAMFDATVGIHPTAGEEFVTMRTRRPDPEPTARAAE